MLPFLGIFEDFYFIMQIFILLTVMSFVFNHYGKNGWSYVIIAVMCYIVFFVIPGLSFGIFLIQVLLGAGVSSLLVDFFFLTQNHGGAQQAAQAQQAQQGGGGRAPEGYMPERADDTGLSVNERVHKAQHAAHASHAMQQMMRRGGGG